ncbi:dnaJ homolog subfamily C member 14 [Aegotheles albertisi]
MEPPRHREAAAGEGAEAPPGWIRDPAGTGGWTRAPPSWNGTCGRSPGAGGDRDLRVPSGPGCSCRCRGGPGAPRGLEEDEDGTGKRPQRRPRHRPTPPEAAEPGKRPRGAPRRSRRDEGTEPGSPRGLLAQPRWLLGPCWARSGSLRVARGLRAGAALVLRLLQPLGTALLLLLLLLLRLCRGAGRCLRGPPGTWGLLGASPPCRYLRGWWQQWDPPRLRELLGAVPACRYLRGWLRWGWQQRDPPGAGGQGEGAAVGPSPGEEVGRLLAMATVPEEQRDPFQVLGVAATTPDPELRKAYHRLAMLVHPDKNPHPRAEVAFKVLRAAWDRVGSPERRREHELRRLAEGELARSVGEFLSRLQEDLREAMNTMGCSKCQGRHRRFELARDPRRARYCGACGGPHPAEEGDLWAESSLLGLRITYLALLGGRVYDITEWAACQRVGIAPDTHRVPYHISCGPRGPPRHRSGSPPAPADLQDFLSRVFQGGSGVMPGGGPFPQPPGTPPGASPRPEGAAPRAEAKHKRRRRTRRPLPR